MNGLLKVFNNKIFLIILLGFFILISNYSINILNINASGLAKNEDFNLDKNIQYDKEVESYNFRKHRKLNKSTNGIHSIEEKIIRQKVFKIFNERQLDDILVEGLYIENSVNQDDFYDIETNSVQLNEVVSSLFDEISSPLSTYNYKYLRKYCFNETSVMNISESIIIYNDVRYFSKSDSVIIDMSELNDLLSIYDVVDQTDKYINDNKTLFSEDLLFSYEAYLISVTYDENGYKFDISIIDLRNYEFLFVRENDNFNLNFITEKIRIRTRSSIYEKVLMTYNIYYINKENYKIRTVVLII